MSTSHPFNRAYFEGEGYAGLYRDFPVHYKTAEVILTTAETVLNEKPKVMLEVGGARGYVSKLIENSGIKVVCMDISEHCFHTRAIDNFILHDATKIPWPFQDGEFDVCFSVALLEHIPENKVDVVIKEMARVSTVQIHGITFQANPNDKDRTHVCLHPLEWWENKFREVERFVILDKEDLEKGPIDIDKYAPADGLVKLNIGSFMDMYHYGWVNVDDKDLTTWATAYGYIFWKHDVTKGFHRHYDDDSVDIILVSHFIEHLTRDEGRMFLKECNRILKPKGVIRLAVPDTRTLCSRYLSSTIKEYSSFNVGVEQVQDDAEALFHLLIGGHKTIYDLSSLRNMLLTAGFKDISPQSFNSSRSEVIRKQTIGMYPTLSLYLEAMKS